MSQLGVWHGPCPLTSTNIQKVEESGQPTVYLVGDVSEDQHLRVKFIDTAQNLKLSLAKWLGRGQWFMYEDVGTDAQAELDKEAAEEYFGAKVDGFFDRD